MSNTQVSPVSVFRRNPSAVHVKKNDKINIVFTDKENSDLITLEGFVGEFFLACDGKKAANEVARHLGREVTPQAQADFDRMLSFLVERDLIVVA